MKKNSKTQDLLKRLGASLKSSPLEAHARMSAGGAKMTTQEGQGSLQEKIQAKDWSKQENPPATKAMAKNEQVATGPSTPWTTAGKRAETQAHAQAGEGWRPAAALPAIEARGNRQPQATPTGAMTGIGAQKESRVGAETLGSREKVGRQDSERRKMIATTTMSNESPVGREQEGRKEFARALGAAAEKQQAKEDAKAIGMSPTQGWPMDAAQEGRGLKEVLHETASAAKTTTHEKTPIQVAEELNELVARAAMPLDRAQVQALQGAPEELTARVKMEAEVPTAESLQEIMDKLGLPLNETQLQQWKELQAVRRAIAELKELKGVAEPSTSPWGPPPSAGSARGRPNGWRTSTIGLYAEDYDKVYEVMNYLRAQTGQVANLSRVIRIALRQLEVGPKILEANTRVRARDGRLMVRRAL